MPPEPSRNDVIYELATVEGLPHEVIGERYGISRQRVGQIVSSHEANSAQTRDMHHAELTKKYRELQRLIDNPKPMHTATGATMANVLTCTCGSRADKMKEHAPDCKVMPVTNESVLIMAAKEQRLILESIRRMEAANLATRDDSQALREVEAYISGQDAEISRLRAANDSLTWEVGILRDRVSNGRVHISGN